jgi:hypothetical protein
MCFDWLVTAGVLTVNPAHAVRGPKHVGGKTPALTTDQARLVLDSIDTSTLVCLRDHALIGVMTYDSDVVAIDPTQARKRLCERRDARPRRGIVFVKPHKHANAPHAVALLRAPRAAMPPRSRGA